MAEIREEKKIRNQKPLKKEQETSEKEALNNTLKKDMLLFLSDHDRRDRAYSVC